MNAALRDALHDCFGSDPAALEEVLAGAELIAKRSGAERHDLLVTLGSGLRDVAEELGTVIARIPLSDIPGVPVPTAEGHGGELLSVELAGAGSDGSGLRALVATGRSHLYEGLAPTRVVRLSQVAAATGIRAAVLTNAGGCLADWQLGEVMAISDHVNFSGQSPFAGATFVDIWQVWDAELTATVERFAQHSGVYALLRGPEFQTRTESVLLRGAGVSMVGMSTVLEAIALHQLGVRVCGMSVVSDLSFAPEATEHEAVLGAVRGAFGTVRDAVWAVAGEVGATTEE